MNEIIQKATKGMCYSKSDFLFYLQIFLRAMRECGYTIVKAAPDDYDFYEI